MRGTTRVARVRGAELAYTHYTFDTTENNSESHKPFFSSRTVLVVTLGGRTGADNATRLARALASPTLDVVTWDRRGTYESTLGGPRYFEESSRKELILPLEDALDLQCLLFEVCALKPSQCVLFGRSSGARLSALVAHASATPLKGLILAPPSGGKIAAEFIAHYYYLVPMELSLQSMQAVVDYYRELDVPRGHPKAFPWENELLSANPAHFQRAMQSSSDWVMSFSDQVLVGLKDTELTSVLRRTTSIVMHEGEGVSDELHTIETARAVATLVAKTASKTDYKGENFPLTVVPTLMKNGGAADVGRFLAKL